MLGTAMETTTGSFAAQQFVVLQNPLALS
ncbi:unnamed protein product, partial [Rotaria sp. Silwood2]